MSARARSHAWRARRALRAAERAEKRLQALSLRQPARPWDSSPVPRPRGGRLAVRLRAGMLTRLLSHPRTAETAALVVGVAVGVVLVAVLVGTLLAAAIRDDSFTPGEGL